MVKVEQTSLSLPDPLALNTTNTCHWEMAEWPPSIQQWRLSVTSESWNLGNFLVIFSCASLVLVDLHTLDFQAPERSQSHLKILQFILCHSSNCLEDLKELFLYIFGAPTLYLSLYVHFHAMSFNTTHDLCISWYTAGKNGNGIYNLVTMCGRKKC